jgi:hypothetical protein
MGIDMATSNGLRLLFVIFGFAALSHSSIAQQRIVVASHQLNASLPPYDVYVEIITSGWGDTKTVRCVILRGEPYNPSRTDYDQMRRQLIPYSYTWKVMSLTNTVERSWLAYFRKNRDFQYLTVITLPTSEFQRSVLELYFEDLDGDGKRDDVTFAIDMSGFNWSPSVELVHQSTATKGGR